jgi:hypothetical protein
VPSFTLNVRFKINLAPLKVLTFRYVSKIRNEEKRLIFLVLFLSSAFLQANLLLEALSNCCTYNCVNLSHSIPITFSIPLASTFSVSLGRTNINTLQEPQQKGQEIIAGVTFATAVFAAGFGLLIFLLKRK